MMMVRKDLVTTGSATASAAFGTRAASVSASSSSGVRLLMFGALLLSSLPLSFANGNDGDYVLRLAIKGGGWRSMMTGLGFAHIFSNAGLLNETHCQFSAISGSSGSAWFITQLAYSQPFLDAALTDNPKDELYNYAVDWMTGYSTMLETQPNNLFCSFISPFGLIPILNDIASFCNLMVNLDTQFAAYISLMLEAGSSSSGDTGFVNRLMTADNKREPFRNTDIVIASGMAANSRYFASSFFGLFPSYNVAYLGPSNNAAGQVYTLPIPFTYTVKSNDTQYRYAVDEVDLPLVTRTETAPGSFSFAHWSEFYLYDKAVGGEILTTKGGLASSSSSSSELLSEPFGGNVATVGQINAMSSAFLCDLSGLVPTYLAHVYSKNEYYIQNDKETGFLSKWWGSFTNSLTAGFLYKKLLGVTGEFAPCSNWPEECDSTTSRFIDGGFTELFSKCKYERRNGRRRSKPSTFHVLLGNINGLILFVKWSNRVFYSGWQHSLTTLLSTKLLTTGI